MIRLTCPSCREYYEVQKKFFSLFCPYCGAGCRHADDELKVLLQRVEKFREDNQDYSNDSRDIKNIKMGMNLALNTVEVMIVSMIRR